MRDDELHFYGASVQVYQNKYFATQTHGKGLMVSHGFCVYDTLKTH